MTPSVLVAVDVSPVRDGTGGIGRYVKDLMAHLPAVTHGKRLRLLPLTNRRAAWDTWFDATGPAAHGPSSATFERTPRPMIVRPTLLWLQAEVPIKCRQRRVAVIHCTTGRAALAARRPTVLTVHDTAAIDAPELFPYRERWLAGLWLRASVPRAHRLICVSHATARDVLRRWPRTAGRLSVIHQGLAEAWLQPAPPLPPALAGAVGGRYWLHVGACTRRKNVAALVEAFALALPTVGAPQPVLALVGPPGDADAEVRATARRLGVQASVRWLGVVTDGALRGLYAGAELSACVSHTEGFGLTALESAGCGCPVVTSGRAGLAEAVPAGALRADPNDVAAMARALRTVATEPSVRARLSAEGRAVAAARSCRRSAERTADVYGRAAPPALVGSALARRF